MIFVRRFLVAAAPVFTYEASTCQIATHSARVLPLARPQPQPTGTASDVLIF